MTSRSRKGKEPEHDIQRTRMHRQPPYDYIVFSNCIIHQELHEKIEFFGDFLSIFASICENRGIFGLLAGLYAESGENLAHGLQKKSGVSRLGRNIHFGGFSGSSCGHPHGTVPVLTPSTRPHGVSYYNMSPSSDSASGLGDKPPQTNGSDAFSFTYGCQETPMQPRSLEGCRY